MFDSLIKEMTVAYRYDNESKKYLFSRICTCISFYTAKIYRMLYMFML